MTHPVDATAYLKHANTLQAEAYAEMCTPDVQPVIAPRLPMTEEDLPSCPDHCWHWTSVEKQVLLDWGNKLTALTHTSQPVIAPALKLTHEMIDAAYRKVWSTVTHRERLAAFAYEIEAAIKSAHGITGDKQ